MKRLSILTLLLLLMLSGCGSKESELDEFNIETARIGTMTGATGELFAIEAYPDAQIDSFANIMDAVAALKAGRLDAVITADVTCRSIAQENPDLERLPTLLTDEHISAGIKKGNDELLDDLNRIIAEMHEDGTLEDMTLRWVESYPPIPLDIPEADGAVLRVGTDPTRPPFTYFGEDNVPTGFAVELAQRIGLALDRRIEFVTVDFAALIPALESGKIDCIIDLMTATDERKKSINFSDSYYISGQNILKLRDGVQTETELTYEDFIGTGKTVAVQTGEIYGDVARDIFDAKIDEYTTAVDILESLKNGRADAALMGSAYVKPLIDSGVYPEFDYLWIPEEVFADKRGPVFHTEELRDKYNEWLAVAAADGTLEEMVNRWIGSSLPAEEDIPRFELTGENGTLRVCDTGDYPPYSLFDTDGEAVGFDHEMTSRFAEHLGMDVEISMMSYGSILSSVASGKSDMSACVYTITDEREQGLIFGEACVVSQGVLIVPKVGGAKDADSSQTFRAEDFAGKKIAVGTGTVFNKLLETHIPDSEPVYINNNIDGIEALKTSKADALLGDDAQIRLIIAKNPGLKMLEPYVTYDEYGIVVSKENEELLLSLNEFIAVIKADGTYDDMLNRWLDSAEPPPMPVIPEGSGETLTLGTSGVTDGFSYYMDGELAGFDIEFAKRFAEYMDMKLEISVMDFGGLIPAVQSGKIDIAANLFAITEERKQSINFTDAYYSGGAAIAVYDVSQPSNTFRAEDFDGKTFAIVTGSIWDKLLEENIPGAIPMYYNTVADVISALQNGKVDATFTNTALSTKFKILYPELEMLEPAVFAFDCAFAFNKENGELRESFNDFLKEIQKNGDFDDMKSYWLSTADVPDMPDIPLTGENGTLTFATSGATDVFSFIQNGSPAGFEVELAMRFAQHMGMDIEISVMDWGALLTAVQSGKADFAADGFAITEERKEFVDFSDTVFEDGLKIAVRSESIESVAAPAEESFFDGVKKSFYQNLIVENRWKMVVDGLFVSLTITIFAFILATFLGFCVCGLRMSKSLILRAIAGVYINILRGTPVLVLLMITFYIIFAKSSISGTVVAIIAFGANGAAFIGEIIRSAILTVDKGQVEAARSMGFSKVGAFFTVTLPQAVRVAFPVYKSEFISMFKMTSVVGYIAIVDLTKAGDIIRSRTYDAFFPLIFVALVYLAAASLMIFLFDGVDKATNKRLRRGK